MKSAVEAQFYCHLLVGHNTSSPWYKSCRSEKSGTATNSPSIMTLETKHLAWGELASVVPHK